MEQKTPDGQVKQVLRIDTRPSDGIAVATRVQCPIYAAEDVLDAAAQQATIVEPDEENEEPFDA